MALDSRLTGREEKRLPVMMEAKLVLADRGGARKEESACIENLSAGGARVCANGPRQPGESVGFIPTVGEGPVQGHVIYCQKLAEGRFGIGLKLRRSPILLSLVQQWKAIVR
jgi:hypothetical protein